jgi:hypothetical protein
MRIALGNFLSRWVDGTRPHFPLSFSVSQKSLTKGSKSFFTRDCRVDSINSKA